MANTGIYDYDPTHWFWACQGCHIRYDFQNGTRVGLVGEDNPFWGKQHTPETKQKMRGPRPSISGENNPNFGKKLSEERIQKLHKHLENQLGEKNHFFNKNHLAQTRLRMVLAWSNRRAAKPMSISGRFHIPRQEWTDEAK